MAAPAGAEDLARCWYRICAASGFVRPSGAERDAGQPGPRVPLRSTRGYSPRPLRGQDTARDASGAKIQRGTPPGQRCFGAKVLSNRPARLP